MRLRRQPVRDGLRAVVVAALAACLPAAEASAAGSPIPVLRPSPSPRAQRDPPMRILRVMSADKACEPNCPEWISAEGIITPDSAAALAKVLTDLGGRRLPVLVSSHGGYVRDALEMGAMIRARGLAVAVARTRIANCPERAPDCPNARGQAVAAGAFCASACPLVLAGGVQRLVGPAPLVGVHQITTVVKETEGLESISKTVKIYEQDWIDKTVAQYLTHMGVGDPVMTLLRKTPAASVHWLSLDEIRASSLATEALDPANPILTGGANGLNGRAFDAGARADLLRGRLVDQDGAGATLTLTYRRGGGALEVALTKSEQPLTSLPADWTAMIAAPASPPPKASGPASASTLMPRDRFCQKGRDARMVATQTSAASPKPKAYTFNFASAVGVRALFAEACSSP